MLDRQPSWHPGTIDDGLGNPLEPDAAEGLCSRAMDLKIHVNRQRRQALAMIPKDDPHTLQKIIYAGIDPMLDVLEDVDAHFYRFACKMVMVDARQVPREEWWSRDFVEAIAAVYPHRSAASYRRLGYLTNNLLNCFAINGLADKALPLAKEVKKASRKMLYRYIQTLVAADAGTIEIIG